jgi:multimeric flavodoxin WrbA
MDKTDQLDQVYEAFVHWADVFLIATPIRWGAASSLYYRMVERMNCVQNQQTTAGRVLLKNKVAAFIVTGGQDGVQAVAGQMLGFFSELGCLFPQFPYIAHSRGWSAEDMENNVRFVKESEELREGARGLVERATSLARVALTGTLPNSPLEPAGRKSHQLDVKAQITPRGPP